MNKKKSLKIFSLLLCLTLCLTTAFGMTVFGADRAQISAPTSLKFRQVELGEDFAVAVSYDNELFGWSLTRTETAFSSDRTTLGSFYPGVPTRIDFNFVKVDGTTINCEGTFITDDRIVDLATTRTTAALLTEKGYIYTWGKEDNEEQDSGLIDMNLLQRTSGEDTTGGYYKGNGDYFLPAIINYNIPSLSFINPSNTLSVSALKPILDISGGDSNYIVKVKRAASINLGAVDFFYWGNSRFGQHNEASINSSKQTSGFYSYDSLVELNNISNMYVGAGNVVYVGTNNNLYVKGKNFYLPSGELSVTGSTNFVLTDKMFNTASGAKNIYVNLNGTSTKLEGALVSEKYFSQVANSNRFGNAEKTAKFTYADGSPLSYSDTEYSRQLDKISLSNGFGYAIASDNSVLFFGNGYNGQAASISAANLKTYNDLTTITFPSGSGAPIQVVAGKIQARMDTFVVGDTTSLKPSIGTVTSNKISVAADKQEQKSDSSFISAMLDDNGSVYAWSNKAAAKKVDFGTKLGTNNNKIVSLSSGYNGVVYALSNLGKMYKITSDNSGNFIVTMHDAFQYKTSTSPLTTATVNNYATEKTNSVHFSVSNDRLAANPLSFNFNANSTAISGNIDGAENAYSTVSINGVSATAATGTNNLKPFVSSNISQDATRFLLSSAQSSFITSSDTVTNFKDESLVSAITGATIENGFADVKFYWSNDSNKTALDINIINKYINFSVSYSGTPDKELSFNIVPLQSTMGRTLVMEFGVGRFDSMKKYGLSSDTDAVFYEAKRAALNITVANTDAKVDNFNAFLGAPPTGSENPFNSSIPVLDPNNFYSKYYSIAMMDVSTGINEVAKMLNGGSASTSIVDSIIDLIKNNDNGFPASSKITDGALDYYYGTAAANTYFANKYPYFASDRDGNRVVFKQIQSYDSYSSKFDVKPETITVSQPLDAISVSDAKKMFLSNDSLFNNLYGFVFNVNEINSTLDITYQVLTLTAKESTNTAIYTGNVIDSVKTSALPDNTGIMDFMVSLSECKNFFTDTSTTSNIQKDYDTKNFPVHIQASISLKDKEGAPKHSVYGNPGKNILIETPSTLTVGSSTGTFTYSLSELFNDSSNMFFAYKGEKAQGEVANNYIKTFDSQLFTISITPTQLTVTPKVSTTFSVPLEIRRYSFDEKLKKADGKDTEYLEIIFKINSSKPTLTLKTGAEQEYMLNQTTKDADSTKLVRTISLNTRINVDAKTWQLPENEFAVINVFSTNNNILKVSTQKVGNDRNLVLEGVTSGIVTVRYSVRLYDYIISDSFDVKIESIVEYKQTLNLTGSELVYLSDLKTDLGDKNKDSSECKDYEGLVLNAASEKENPMESVYYQRRLSGEVWSNMDASIPFLKDVRFQYDNKNPDRCSAIRLEIADVVNSDSYEYRVVVKFKSLDNAFNFEIAIVVTPGKKQLKDDLNDLSFVLHMDKAQSSLPDFELNTDGSVPEYKISLKTILKYLPDKDVTTWVDSKVFTVNYGKGANLSNSELTKFTELRYDDDFIYLSMKYPTQELEGGRLPIDVTIKKDDSTIVLSFYVEIDGIKITLDKKEYGMLFIITLSSVFALLFIIFMIRMGIFWKKKAEQKRIIRKNQMLIKMRDKMHNRTEAISKGQIVKTKLKMEDPKYAKMFTQMRKDKEAETGISLDNSVVAHKAENKATAFEKAAKGSKKKKGGKKSIEELKAELEAKKAAFAAMQHGDIDIPSGGPMDSQILEDAPMFEASSSYSGELSREDVENQIKAKLAADEENILFDVDVITDDKNNI